MVTKVVILIGMEGLERNKCIRALRREIRMMEGLSSKVQKTAPLDLSFGPMDEAFPDKTFPRGAVHEFISASAPCVTASNGFIAGVVSALMKHGGHCLWISTSRSLYPPALAYFGIKPHELIFVDVSGDRDALWVTEQALRCNALAAVVTELSEVSFEASRRLQLSVEKSSVTGFLHRRRPRGKHPLACTSRFSIRPAASRVPDGLPGPGHPHWEVRLEKIRNGRPGSWRLGWEAGRFVHISGPCVDTANPYRNTRYA